jgi:hypothetical protein
MANIRNKIFGLIGATAAFAGMAYGQASCTTFTGSFGLGQVSRAESATDLVGETTLTCTNTTAAAVAASGAGTNAAITLFVSAPVTSKVLQTLALPAIQYTEALAVVSVKGGFGGGIYSATQGVVTPAGIAFTNIPTPGIDGTGTPATDFFSIQFVNVRANTTGGATSVTEQPFITGSAIMVPGAPSALTVATVAAGLAPAKLSTDMANQHPISSAGLNQLICASLAAQSANGNTAGLQTPAFWVHTGETFQTSFKSQGPGATPAAFGSEFLNNTETGIEPSGVANPATGLPYAFNQTSSLGTANQANFGTRIQLVFNNVPAGMSLYVPSGVASDVAGEGTLLLVTSATASEGSNASSVTATSGGPYGSFTAGVGVGPVSQLTVTTGSATAVYEVNAQNPLTIESYSIPVFPVAAAGTLAASGTTPMTVTVSFAPIVTSTVAPLATIPSFISLSTALNVSNEVTCSTTLLFPYVTQGNGFDFGIAIENTSTDNLGKAGVSSATNQSGTCSANFYGTGGSVTPSAAGTTFPGPTGSTGNVFGPGTGSATLLSVLDPGFTGYIIVLCNFQYAHGYGYVFTNYGTANATVTSYLAIVLPTSAANRSSTGTSPDIAAGFESGAF